MAMGYIFRRSFSWGLYFLHSVALILGRSYISDIYSINRQTILARGYIFDNLWYKFSQKYMVHVGTLVYIYTSIQHIYRKEQDDQDKKTAYTQTYPYQQFLLQLDFKN